MIELYHTTSCRAKLTWLSAQEELENDWIDVNDFSYFYIYIYFSMKIIGYIVCRNVKTHLNYSLRITLWVWINNNWRRMLCMCTYEFKMEVANRTVLTVVNVHKCKIDEYFLHSCCILRSYEQVIMNMSQWIENSLGSAGGKSSQRVCWDHHFFLPIKVNYFSSFGGGRRETLRCWKFLFWASLLHTTWCNLWDMLHLLRML